jgi:hypothetical protein
VLPGRTTRNSSRIITSGRGAKIAPNTEAAQSKRSSSNGRSSASATTHSTSTPSASVRARPFSTISGVRSDATTDAPSSAASSARFPVPAPTSRTSWPALIAQASSRF